MKPNLYYVSLDQFLSETRRTMMEPRNKVTKQHIIEQIADVDYVRLGGTVILCSITMKNGFSVRGESACIDPNEFDEALGKEIAYDNAFGKLWELEGYLLADERHRTARGDTDDQEKEKNTLRYNLLMDIRELLHVGTFEDILPRIRMTYANNGRGMTFGAALAEMKNGRAVGRTGWNGKGMFVYMVPANRYIPTTEVAKRLLTDVATGLVPYNAYFAIRNVIGTVSTWVPSVNDCIAEDWYIHE